MLSTVSHRMEWKSATFFSHTANKSKQKNKQCLYVYVFFCMLQNRPSSISVSRREWLIYEQRTDANVLFWGGTNDIPTHQQGEKGVKILFTKDGTFYLYEDDDSALVSWCALLMNEHSSSRINSGWSKRGHCVPVLFRSVQASSDRQNEQIQKNNLVSLCDVQFEKMKWCTHSFWMLIWYC